ncbi:MAG: sigma-70 family RNA polymerase sigma factor [Parvularculaceae bacterium]|nr:sigma-70 family RNA polymerase sigma factor [Parvularculaceae bacterium]
MAASNPANEAAPTAERLNGLLLRVASDGDRDAFNALFQVFAPRIKSYLMKIGAAADLADDLSQEAMLRVWRKAKLFDPGKASASTWIFTIARNVRIDAARRAAKPELDPHEPAFAPEHDPHPDQIIDIGARDERIRMAFSALPPAQHEVVKLHFIEDLAHAEIAERLRLPLGTVKSRLRLAFEKIRKELGDCVA